MSVGGAFSGQNSGGNLERFKWQQGRSGNPSGRPKGLVSLKRRFREAFNELPPDGKESLVSIVLSIARGDGVSDIMRDALESGVDPDNAIQMGKLVANINRRADAQLNAIKFAASYGFGPPPKSLDDDTVRRLAEQMAAQMLDGMIAEAEARRADQGDAAIDTTATVVGDVGTDE